jgi:hypothetical protein
VNVEADTDEDQIAIQWNAPQFNGGSSVLDYRVWYDNASNGVTFRVLEE